MTEDAGAWRAAPAGLANLGINTSDSRRHRRAAAMLIAAQVDIIICRDPDAAGRSYRARRATCRERGTAAGLCSSVIGKDLLDVCGGRPVTPHSRLTCIVTEMAVAQDDDAGAPMRFRPLFVELSRILLLVTVVACHPGGGEAQHPELPAQQIGETQLPDPPAPPVGEVHHPPPLSQKIDVKRPIYARFFQQLKRQVALAWNPTPVWQRADPAGTRYGPKTRATELRVSLSPQGELVQVLVVSPSGSNELDEEAVRAFQAAAPFPNPPEGLVEKDNLLTFSFSLLFQPR